MTNPTTPFSWQMPTSTDLVTDLPADFETFGQAVATSMADLLGGTTGQILSKASNTDMDFTWTSANPGDITGVTAGTGISGGGTSGDVTITNSMATAIDAKGDLIGGTGADTFSRLAVGTNGQVLTADSTAATGLAWATASTGSTNVAGKNAVLNSAMNVWQRGTSVACAASSNLYTTDRWKLSLAAGASYTVSRQSTNDTTNLPFIQYAARVQRDLSQTGVNPNYFIQGIETVNSIAYAGKTVTFSFYARKGANYSAASDVLTFLVAYGTGTDQDPAGAYTGQANAINTTATLTTTWQRFTASATIPATATEIKTFFTYTPVGVALTNDYYEVTGVQLEIAASASTYSPNASTYQAELAACQRYYQRFTDSSTASLFCTGIANSTTSMVFVMNLPVSMRIKPTTVDYSALQVSDSASNYVITALSSTIGNTTQQYVSASVSSGLTQFRPGYLQQNTLSGYLGFGAEL